MAAEINWTPLGCAPLMSGLNRKRPDEAFDFYCDLIHRAGQLDLDRGDLFFAGEIARLAENDMSSMKKQALILLILAVRAMSVEGSTRLPLTESDHFDRVLKDLQANDDEMSAVEELLRDAEKAGSRPDSGGLANIFGGPDDYRPLIFDHGCLYIQKLHVLEARVGAKLNERISFEDRPADIPFEEVLQEVFATPPTVNSEKAYLDEQQKQAVRTASSGRIAVISGRPGSGKTSIVASILRVLARAGRPALESIALAAPTGKAADRMRQSVTDHLAAIEGAGEIDRRLIDDCPPSSTLHRLLGYSPSRDRFWHNELNPLPEQLVIVDESSMIDLAMMDHLLRALQPEARLIMLGDADQLPSIDAGAVLRDLCRSEKVAKEHKRVVVLGKSYRAREDNPAGKRILEVAAAINEGKSPADAGGGKAMVMRKTAEDITFEGVEHLAPENPWQREAFLARWYELLCSGLPDLDKRISHTYRSGSAGFDTETAGELKKIIAHFDRFRILCATRMTAGDTGSEDINAWFYQRWLEHLREGRLVSGNPHFLVGEPVIMTRNDYSLRLYNGDSGLVLNIALESATRQRSAEPMAVFPRSGSFVAYPLETLRGRLEPAWATTVHKAQGSEYENVAIVLPEVHVRPLSRELLYTAVTRAKKSVVIVGSTEVLNSGVDQAIKRASGLADMLG